MTALRKRVSISAMKHPKQSSLRRPRGCQAMIRPDRLREPATSGRRLMVLGWFVVNNKETGGLVQIVFPQSFADDLATKPSNS
jgi:hypothetical protein